MPKDAAEKLNRLDEFNQAQITDKAERVKKNQQRAQSLQLVESQREGVARDRIELPTRGFSVLMP